MTMTVKEKPMSLFRTVVLAALLAAGLPLPHAMAADYKLGALTVAQPTARPSMGSGRASVAYFVVTNDGAAPDRLMKAESPVAASVELHTHLRDGDVMRMRPVAAIDLPPGRTVALEPGSFHVMLIGVKQPLKAGDKFPMTLTFEKAGKLDIEVPVEAPGAKGGGMEMKGGTEGHQHRMH